MKYCPWLRTAIWHYSWNVQRSKNAPIRLSEDSSITVYKRASLQFIIQSRALCYPSIPMLHANSPINAGICAPILFQCPPNEQCLKKHRWWPPYAHDGSMMVFDLKFRLKQNSNEYSSLVLFSHCGALGFSCDCGWCCGWDDLLYRISGLLGVATLLLKSPDLLLIKIGDNIKPISALDDNGDVARTWSVPDVTGWEAEKKSRTSGAR